MEWKYRPDAAPTTWIVYELARRVMDIGIAVQLSTGEVAAGLLDDWSGDRTELHINTGSVIEIVPTAAVTAYAFIGEADDRSDELRG